MSDLSDLATSHLTDGPVLTRECKEEVARAISHILDALGEDVSREGLSRTPERVARMYDELLAGYAVDAEELLNGALFDVEYNQMVVVKHIEFYSLCEHHLLPFLGHAHVGYLPSDRVVGLSKIPRLVDMFARRLQVQERMTHQIAGFLQDLIRPEGVGVVIQATHLCSAMRGAQKSNARMVTSAMLGQFERNLSTREEFMAHLRYHEDTLF